MAIEPITLPTAASEAVIQRAAQKLRANNIEVVVVDTADEARDAVLDAASATGNQLAAYAGGAGRVILVVGSQKLVPDLDAAFRRIREVVFPYEDARVRATLGVGTKLEKVLVTFGEWTEGRTTVI